MSRDASIGSNARIDHKSAYIIVRRRPFSHRNSRSGVGVVVVVV
jgi:hypothetical protein